MSRRKQRKVARETARDSTQQSVRVNVSALRPYNSYGTPAFVARGYYEDVGFSCADCGSSEVWRATQQKWWYEVAKGYVYSGPKLCRPCRRREQSRKAQARRIHLEGIACKKNA